MNNNGNSNDPHQNDHASAQPRTGHDADPVVTHVKDPEGAIVLLWRALLDFSKSEQQGLFAHTDLARNCSDSEFRLAEHLLDLALQNYARCRTPDAQVAKAAAEFGVQGAYRLMDAASEVLEEGVGGLSPEQITDRIIAGTVERVEECAPPELDHIVRAYLAEVQRAPQQSDKEGRKPE